MAARTLFRASLAYLPLFMAGLVAARVPNTHGAAAPACLQLRLPAAAAGACRLETLDEALEDQTAGARHARLAAAPFPFLPLPRLPAQLRCPHRAYCEIEPELPPPHGPAQALPKL